jgi:hypothetical protein
VAPAEERRSIFLLLTEARALDVCFRLAAVVVEGLCFFIFFKKNYNFIFELRETKI